MKPKTLQLVSLVIPLILLTGCSNQESADVKATMMPKTNNSELESGVHDRSVVSSCGEILRYTISIPDAYDGRNPTPLVLALHYGGKVTPHFARGIVEALVVPGLGELNAIVLAPDSIAGPWSNEKNEDAVLEVLDYVVDHYNIDQSRILLTGFSKGGHGTWYIGSRHQDRFSALIPIAGAPMVADDVVWTIPIYVIHSRADTVVPIEPTEEYVQTLNENDGQNIVFVAVDDLPHFQTARFAKPLRDAVPWVKSIWSEGK